MRKTCASWRRIAAGSRHEKSRPGGGSSKNNPKVARVTGLEPATLGVTGRYSNQLSYTRALRCSAPLGAAHLVEAPIPVNAN